MIARLAFCRWCGKRLVQKANEPDYDFRARVFCNPGCAKAHTEAKQ